MLMLVVCAAYLACMYLSGVRWWGRSISVRPSKAKHVKMPREGDQVSIQ